MQNIFSSEVTSTLDRVTVSDRAATFIIAATANSLGHDISRAPLSRSSIRRERLVNRTACAKTVKHSFNPDIRLVIRLDGKRLSDITRKSKVDHLLLLVMVKMLRSYLLCQN